MRIGIISDTHGEKSVWDQLVNTIFSKIDLILHAGDVLYHGPRNPIPLGYNPKELAQALNLMHTPILIAQGNCDADVDQLLINSPLAHPYLFTVVNGKRVLVHHGHIFSGETLEQLMAQWKIDLCISGHTHIPDYFKINNCNYFNPGSCAIPKGDGIATVGLWEEDTLKLLEVKTGKVLKYIQL